MPKCEANKDIDRHDNVEEEKPTRSQPHTKNYSQLRKASVGVVVCKQTL